MPVAVSRCGNHQQPDHQQHGGLERCTATAGIAFPNRSQQSSAQPAGISSEPHGAAFPRYAQTGSFSDPVLNDNIVYKNRSFYFLAQPATQTSPSPTHLYLRGTTNEAPVIDSNYTCAATTGTEGYFWDLGIVGDSSPTPGTRHQIRNTRC